MSRLLLILSFLTLVAGCEEPAQTKRHVPPDDMSNGPWKYQEEREADAAAKNEETSENQAHNATNEPANADSPANKGD